MWPPRSTTRAPGMAEMMQGADFAEGVAALTEKRPPRFPDARSAPGALRVCAGRAPDEHRTRLGTSRPDSLTAMPRIEIRDRTLRDITMGQDSYILLFLLLIIDYLSLSLVDSAQWGGLIHVVPITVSVLVGLHTSGAHKRTIQVSAVVLFIALLGAIAQVINQNRQVGAFAFFMVAILLAITAITIMGRILRHRHVSIETMFGAVSVYILIGLFFSSLFIGIALASSAHHLGPFLAQPGPHNSSDYVYLSFVTLTTVGFGDLTPYTDLARSVVVLEALIGQIFLVTLVARLVTLFGLERPLLAKPATMTSRPRRSHPIPSNWTIQTTLKIPDADLRARPIDRPTDRTKVPEAGLPQPSTPAGSLAGVPAEQRHGLAEGEAVGHPGHVGDRGADGLLAPGHDVGRAVGRAPSSAMRCGRSAKCSTSARSTATTASPWRQRRVAQVDALVVAGAEGGQRLGLLLLHADLAGAQRGRHHAVR